MNQPVNHWLDNARHVPSPNCNDRPANTEISLLVIHNISLPAGQFGNQYIEQLFTNCLDCSVHDDFASLNGLEVSAHLLIDRMGGIVQFVPFNKKAWHAGQSSFNGRSNCNDFSIGIELEGLDDTPYTDQQYQSLMLVTQELIDCYPLLSLDQIVGHCDIAPDRKTDPGPAFNWRGYLESLVSK